MAERRTLLELDVGGAVHGFVIDNEPVLVELADGSMRAFGDGATVDDLPARSARLLGGGGADGGGVHVTLQLAALDLWASRGTVQPQRVNGRVYWWPVGDVLRPEHEIWRGSLRNPDWDLARDEHDDQAGQVSFDLAPPTRNADVAFPPSACGDEGRLDGVPEGSTGNVMPVIYGTVRGVQLVAVSDTTVTPVRLLIAGHPVGSSTIDVLNGDGTLVVNNATVSTAVDNRGDHYAYVTVTAVQYSAASGNLHTDEVTGWTTPDGQALDRLGDVLLHLWITYAGERFFELDRDRAWAARPRLNRYQVAMFWNDRSDTGTVLRTLAGRIEPQFPVVFGFAGGRFGWDAVDFPRGDTPPTRVLTFGLDAEERVGLRETSSDDVVTEFELTYGFDGFDGGPTEPLRADRTNNGTCRGAESRWGPSTIARFSCPDVQDVETAVLILDDHVRRRSAVRASVTYRGLDDTWFTLPLGHEVAVVDLEAGWDLVPFVVEGRKPRLDGRVDVALLERDGH